MSEAIQQLVKRHNADSLKRQKAQLKRTATTLRSQVESLGAFLSERERAQLSASVDLLERWSSRVDKAYTMQHQNECQAKEFRQQRCNHSRLLFADRYIPSDLHEKIIITCALSDLYSPNRPELSEEKLVSKMQWFDDNADQGRCLPGAVKGLVRMVDEAWRAMTDELIDEVVWDFRQESVDDAFARISTRLDAAIDRQRGLLVEVLATCDTWMVQHRIVESNALAVDDE